MMQSGFFYKDLEQVGVLLLVQKSVVIFQLRYVHILKLRESREM